MIKENVKRECVQENHAGQYASTRALGTQEWAGLRRLTKSEGTKSEVSKKRLLRLYPDTSSVCYFHGNTGARFSSVGADDADFKDSRSRPRRSALRSAHGGLARKATLGIGDDRQLLLELCSYSFFNLGSRMDKIDSRHFGVSFECSEIRHILSK